MSPAEPSYLIGGGRPLKGTVAVSGSKNAALYAIAAGLLTADTLTLNNVPRIADIDEMAELLRSIGSQVEVDGETVRIATPEITCTAPPADQVLRLRASFLLMGPLLARAGAEVQRGLEEGHARIDRYTLVSPLGEGGFGTVWLASQEEPVRRGRPQECLPMPAESRAGIRAAARATTETCAGAGSSAG